MSHVHASQRIEAPIDHVWTLAIDPATIPQYNPYMVTRNISGPLDRVGTTMQTTMRVLHMTNEADGTIVDVEPKRLIRIRGTSPQGTSEWTYRFEPQGEATLATLDIEYDPTGIVGEVLDRVVFERALERVARHIAENFAALAVARLPVPA
jgi:uncharacterized protein YndB with AHSA1/START domain